MDGCYINVQFFAIICCKIFLSVLNYTTATKAWRLRNIGEHMTHTKDEALKLALEALEVSTAAQNKRAASKYAEWRWLKATGLSQKEESELKDAYYESEKEAAECEYRRDSLVVETIAVIKQALAAPVQPVADAWMHKDGRLTDAKAKTARVENFHGWRPLAFISSAAQPAPVQDLPFGVGGGLVAIKTLLSRDPCVHANTAIEMIDAILKEHPAAPPAAQRQWVGLTEEEIAEGLRKPFWEDAARALEAKLKEKNSG